MRALSFALLFSGLIFSTGSWAVTPAKRVITLSPHATELAFSAGLGDHIIAVSEGSDFPPQAQGLERVANYQGINIERIIALQPDLIITWPAGNPPRALEQLRQFGFTLYSSQTRTLADIADNIDDLSQYATNPTIGQKAATAFREQLKKIQQTYDTQTPVRYFYQLSDKPIITLAQNNWPSDVFHFCGGENVFHKASAPYPQVSPEQVILANPDVFFTSPHATAAQTMWNTWQQNLSAIAKHRIWPINADWLNRPTMRTLRAVDQVCAYMQQIRENK